MDEFDESMGADLDNGRGSKVAVIAVWIAIVGIVVGVTGIFLANQAQVKLRKLEAHLATKPDKSAEYDKTLKDLDERLVKLGAEFVKLGRQDRQIQENTQAAFDSVTRDIRTNREGLNEVSEKLGELVAKLENWKPSTKPPAAGIPAGGSSSDGEATVTASGESVHFVQSGDTLSGIAKRYGVSLSSIQQANPMVNPRALQIGQRIVIPKP